MNNDQIINQEMDIENTHGHEESSYHMRSVKFYCDHCKREFGVINPENHRGTCPRCDNVSTTLAVEKNNQAQQQQSNAQSANAQNNAERPSQQNDSQRPHINVIRHTILRPGQTLIFETFSPGLPPFSPQVIFQQRPQPQQQQQQQQQQRPQTQTQQQQSNGLLAGLESLFGQQQQQQQQQQQAQSQSQQQSGGFLSGLGNLLGLGQQQPQQQSNGLVAGVENLLGLQNGTFTNAVNGLIDALRPPQQPEQRFIPNPFGSNPADLFGEQPQQSQRQPQFQFVLFPPQQHVVFGFNPLNMLFAPNNLFFAPGSADYERLIEEFLRNDPNNYGPAPASQQEINKLNEFQYEAGTCKNVDCTVCQEDYQNGDKCVSLPCGHNYHKDCVVEWLTRHDSCPICRKSLSGVQQQPSEHQAASFNMQRQQQTGF